MISTVPFIYYFCFTNLHKNVVKSLCFHPKDVEKNVFYENLALRSNKITCYNFVFGLLIISMPTKKVTVVFAPILLFLQYSSKVDDTIDIF